jgi:hypothetical protein
MIHQGETFIQKLQIGVQVKPIIVIAFSQLPFGWLARVLPFTYASSKFSIRKKWGVSVNKIDAAFIFRQKRGHH